MKVGIIGLPGVGVTTVFCLFTGRDYSEIALNSKIEINLGETKVPDVRIDHLAEIFNPKKKVFPIIEFADIPVELEGSGSFSSKTVNSARSMDALAVVIRAFSNPAVPHSKDNIDPLRDLNSICEEAILTDMIQVENRLERVKKEGRMKSQEGELLTHIKEHLEQNKPIRELSLTPEEMKSIAGYRFITEKPWLILINIDPEKTIATDDVVAQCDKVDFPWLCMAGQLELEISHLDPEDRQEFLKDIGEKTDAKDRFIRGAYKYLDLISFITVGEDECRAWSINRGSDCVTAAGKIHSDLARGFIRADVISYDEFMTFKDMNQAKKAGKLRLEGKNYIVQDGDILNIRFSI